MVFLHDVLHKLTVSEKALIDLSVTFSKCTENAKSYLKISTERNSVQCDLNMPLKCGVCVCGFLLD